MKKEYRFPAQIVGIKCDPLKNLSLFGRLFSWFRPGVASEPGNVSFRGAYNYHQEYTIISEALAKRLKYPFETAPVDGLGVALGKPFNRELKHSATIDIAVDVRSGTCKINKVWFYVAEGVDSPCDIILGRITFLNEGLDKHMPRFVVEDRYAGAGVLFDSAPFYTPSSL